MPRYATRLTNSSPYPLKKQKKKKTPNYFKSVKLCYCDGLLVTNVLDMQFKMGCLLCAHTALIQPLS